MVNKVWGFLIITGLFYGLFNNSEILSETILSSAVTSLDMISKIFPVMALWLGIAKIAEESGLLKKMSFKLSHIMKYIFPEIPSGHESLTYISSNIVANMFGLGNAATPFGLKAMQSLQSLNKDKTKATRSMITFLVLNTSGITIIPTTILSLRMMYGSVDATQIVFPCFVISLLSTIIGLLFDKILARYYK